MVIFKLGEEIRKDVLSIFLKSIHLNKQTRGLVSKETVVLRRWGRETQNFGFINCVDKVTGYRKGIKS